MRLALGALAASLLLVATAHAERVIGPDQEERVLALFAPAGLGEEVVPGYRLMDVAIRRHEIAVRLEPRAGAGAPERSLTTELRTLGEPGPAGTTTVGETPSFLVVAIEEPSESERRALDAFAARVRQNDDGRFWTDVAVEAEATSGGVGGARLGVLLGAGALVTLLAAALVTLIVRRKRQPKPSEHVE